MAQRGRNTREQDRPRQARQQIAREGRPATQPGKGQKGKRPMAGDYQGGLECEGSPATDPKRAAK